MSRATMVRLRDLGQWSGGNTPSKANPAYWAEGSIPWVSPKDMKVDEITSSEDRISESALAEGRVTLLPAGSVLIVTRSGILSHTLPVAVTKTPVTINQDLKALIPNLGVFPNYVAHALRGASRRILKECSKHGTTVASIETNVLLDFEIPLVDLDEQRRIVAELDKQFSRLDEAIVCLKRVITRLNAYRERALDDAFASEPNATLGQLISEGPQNGLYLPKNAYGGGTPIVRIDDYQTNWLRAIAELRRVRATDSQMSTWALQPGDLLVNRVNSMSHLGKCVVVPETLAGALFESNIMRFRLVPRALPRYVELYLGSRVGKRRLTANAKWAVNQASINQRDVQATEIPLPSPERQAQIVAEVDRHLSIVDEVEAEVGAKLKRAQALHQAVLTSAFSGRPGA